MNVDPALSRTSLTREQRNEVGILDHEVAYADIVTEGVPAGRRENRNAVLCLRA